MRVCVVGLGAVGGLLAARLLQNLPPGRVQLTALARGATLRAVRAHGLRLRVGNVDSAWPLQVSDAPQALGPQDLVILAVKATALSAVLPAVAALCGPQTQLLTAMNGLPWWFFHGAPAPCAQLALRSVDPGGAWASTFPSHNILGGVVHLASASPEPGLVQPGFGNGLILGRAGWQQQPTQDDRRLRDVAELLTQAGLAVTVSQHIQRDIWFKLWGNMTVNPVSALTGATTDRILDDDLVRNFMSAVMREAQALGSAFGIPINQDPEERHAVTRKLGAFRTSMLQDLQAQRPLEIDALLGAAHEVAQHLGHATPYMDALLGLLRLKAQGLSA
jgi:2-dehydropantoate 2-reductase